MLMVIILVAGDFLNMSLTTDNVRPSPAPSVWRIGKLTLAGVFVGLAELLFCTALLLVARLRLGYGIETLRTLAFVAVVFGSQATTYVNRARPRLWSTRPSLWLLLSSSVDLSLASTMAALGLAMAPLPLLVIVAALAGAVAFAFLVDVVKVPVFRRLGII